MSEGIVDISNRNINILILITICRSIEDVYECIHMFCFYKCFISA